jgi:predicted amidohydrolase YtcJ
MTDSMRSRCAALLFALLALVPAAARAEKRPSADLILTNAKVYTADNSQPRAEAVAVIGPRIVAVGSSAEVDAWRGAGTRVIDAGGKLVVPGFNDAHVHFMDASLGLASVHLKDAGSAEDFVRRIAQHAQKVPPHEWIQGGNWDEQGWTAARFPTRELIDPVTPHNPAALNRYDGHTTLANSLALKAAGITAQTPDPPGGRIDRDAQGNPTGILRDGAQALLDKAIPPPSHDQLLRAARRGLALAASLGVTSMQEMSNSDENLGVNVDIYKELEERGELTARFYVAPSITAWQDQARLGIRHAFGSAYLRVGANKAFADGSLGSSTAYMFQPFSDDPRNHGLLTEQMQPLSKMRNLMLGADRAGEQLCIHAIGDQATSITLDLFEAVARADGEKDRRFRIEHAQHMAPKDFDRFARLNVIASVQPYHAIDDGRWAEKRIGQKRASTTYAFQTFLYHGVHLALGTDWDVAPLDPLQTVYAAVTRATLDGKNPNGWFPEEKLTVAQTVDAYTMGSAYAEFQEKDKGSITAGKLADLVILSDDVFTIDPRLIREVKVDTTVVGGKVVFERNPQPAP